MIYCEKEQKVGNAHLLNRHASLFNIFLAMLPLFLACIFILSSCEDTQPELSQSEPTKPKPTKLEPCQPNPSQSKGHITYEDEPYFKEQWYLYNEGDIHINVVPVWKQGYGTKPISVGIIDDAIDIAHPDLTDSVLVEGLGSYDSKKSHGTKVAGLLAARDNGKGIIGVAPQAKICSYGYVGGFGPFKDILNREEYRDIAVYNLSGGLNNLFVYKPLGTERIQAMDMVTQDGFEGRGSSLVVAAGNMFLIANNDGFLHYHAVIAVNAIGPEGKIEETEAGASRTLGANLWITAPSKSKTTINGGGYAELVNTSAATPLVSGAIALLRSEYPTLTWRDVKLILAESAKKYDDAEENAEYREIGRMYSSDNMQFYSYRLGFGLLDIAAAFDMAEHWELLPDMKIISRERSSLDIKRGEIIPLEIQCDIQFIESVTIEIKRLRSIITKSGERSFFDVLDVYLSSPNGKQYRQDFIFIRKFSTTTTLLFNTFLGQPAKGTWELVLKTGIPDKTIGIDPTITMESLKLTIRGH